MSSDAQPRDTLYYDGHCDLCMVEMDKLRALKNDTLLLVDIHALPASDELPDRDTLLRTLHYQRADGQFLTGLEANVAAWQHTPNARRWRVLLTPLVKPCMHVVYSLWARWRYRRLYARAGALSVPGARPPADAVASVRQGRPPQRS